MQAPQKRPGLMMEILTYFLSYIPTPILAGISALAVGAGALGLMEAALRAERMRLPIIAWVVMYPVIWSYQASAVLGWVVEGAVVLLIAMATYSGVRRAFAN